MRYYDKYVFFDMIKRIDSSATSFAGRIDFFFASYTSSSVD